MYYQGPKHSRCKFNNFVIQAFSLAIFFQKYSVFCRVKTVEVEVGCYLKLVDGGSGF